MLNCLTASWALSKPNCTKSASKQQILKHILACVALAAIALPAWADQTRSTSFSYYSYNGNGGSLGQLYSETVEPVGVSTSGSADYCLNTYYNYDSHGNKIVTTTSACSGVSSAANFTSRVSGVNMDSNGQFTVASTNAKNQSETYNNIDARFGIATSQTGPNGLTSTVTLDELGRKTKQTSPDGSYTTTNTYSCLSSAQQGYDSSDTNAGVVLPDPQGSACNLVSFNHPMIVSNPIPVADYVETQYYAPNGTAQGGVTRVYHDTQGREIAIVKTGIDLAGQSTFYTRVLKAYDSQGRQLFTSTVHKIDTNGNLLSGSTIRWNVSTVDRYGRPKSTYTPDDSGVSTYSDDYIDGGSKTVQQLTGSAHIETLDYSTDGQVTASQITSNGSVKISTEEKNAMGQLLRKTDNYGNQIAYSYDEEGQLVSTKDGAGNITTLTYDIRGRKTKQVDPDLGTWTYAYDALGQLISQTDAKSQTQTMSYDILGRLTQKVTPEFQSNYFYDCNRASNLNDSSSYPGIGSLCEENTFKYSGGTLQNYGTGYQKLTAFDSLGRAIHTHTVLGVGTSGQRVYDSRQSYYNGRLASTTYPTGVQTQPQYSTNGFVIGLNRTDVTAQSLWKVTGLDQWGNIQQWQLGNGLITTEYRDVMGRLTSKATGPSGTSTIQNVSYSYTQAGDLANRVDTIDNLTETFSHDNLHRLVQWTRQSPYQTNGSYTVGYTYDGLGDLLYRSDRGCFAYPAAGSAHPHAVATLYNSDCSSTSSANTVTSFSYDTNGSTNTVTQNGSSLRQHVWTSFHQPSYISWNAGSPQQVQWLYDPDFNRVQETKLINSGGTWVTEQQIYRLNPGNAPYFEQVVNTASGSPTEDRHYITTPVGIVGMLVTYGEIGSGTTTSNAVMRYWHTDHLGSITVLTDASGNVLERFQFDPYGERLDSEGHDVTASRYTDRGFTQHEHIDDLNLIHMNGRIYDPILGRFLSADPTNQAPDFLQSYNKYSYCVNNPMLCTDPSGYSWLEDRLNALGSGIEQLVSWGVHPAKVIDSHISYGFENTLNGIGAYFCGYAAAFCYAGATAMNNYAHGSDAGDAYEAGVQGGVKYGLEYGINYAIGGYFAGASIPGDGFLGTSLTVGQYAAYVSVHAVAAGSLDYAWGGSFRDAALGAGFSAAATPLTTDIVGTARDTPSIMERTAIAAVIGGTASELGGGKFANGAISAAFEHMYNAEGDHSPKLKLATELAPVKSSVKPEPGLGNFDTAIADTLLILATDGLAAEIEGLAADSTEVVYRWMSRAELKATEETGLLRGGRDGTHYVTDAANSDPLRARLRTSLPQTPEVQVKMEVQSGVFSAPSRVDPAFNMPGGGMERTAVGKVPVRILGVRQ